MGALRRMVKAVYYKTAGPLLRRVGDDTRAELWRAEQAFLQFHEDLTRRVGDELVRMQRQIDALKAELEALKPDGRAAA